MKTRIFIWLAIAGAITAGIFAGLSKWRTQPLEVQFAHVTRETISSSVPTNGKVEPVEWAAAKAERAGPVEKILIQRGQRVTKDQPLVELAATDARASLVAAQTRIAQAHADLDLIRRGGRATDLTDIATGLDRARLDLEVAQKDYEALERLNAKNAATPYEVQQAKEKVDRAKLQIQSLEERKKALATPAPDRAAAQARLDDAEAAARLAQTQIDQSVVRAPIGGEVYQFDLKPGAYLNAGDTVALIGQLDRVHVNVFVDEPDLGRVARGMPVMITWDARPGSRWQGEVDRTPTQIVAQGTRQVGEVVCIIRNEDRGLLPGTNVNAEIVSETAKDAQTVPKEAIRNEHGQTGVYMLAGDRLQWKNVKLRVENTTRTQIEGLNEGDAVALYSEKPLHDGMIVRPVFPDATAQP